VPLSARGREQARALARALKDDAFTHAFSSDLSRALETARAIVAEHRSLPIGIDERLREFDFGQWEGRTWAQIIETSPDLQFRAPTQARLYEPPGGERFEHVVERFASFASSIRQLGPNAKVLAVAHAGVLHAALAALQPEGVDPLAATFSTASFTRFAMNGDTARIITLNDVRHLDPSA
jgi:broad specificity phosphatase PhoE